MQSTTNNVEDYILEADTTRQEALGKLRKICLENLVGFEEKMMYGMVCYFKNDISQVSFANQKNYITIYFPDENLIKDNQETIKKMGKGVSTGKHCIKFAKVENIDYDFLTKVLLAVSNQF